MHNPGLITEPIRRMLQ